MNIATKRDAGSSTESILPPNDQQAQVVPGTNKTSKEPSIDAAGTPADYGIQVRQDFSVGFDARSEQDSLAFECNRRPLM